MGQKKIPSTVIRVQLDGETVTLGVAREGTGVRIFRRDTGRPVAKLRGGFRGSVRGIAHRGLLSVEEAEAKLAPLFGPDDLPQPLKRRCCGGR